MNNNDLFVAVHRNGENIYSVGVFTDLYKAQKACQDFEISEYDEPDFDLKWKIEYEDDDGIWITSARVDDGKYLCSVEVLDRNFNSEYAQRKRDKQSSA